MNDKQQLLTTLREEFHRWEELLARMSEEQIMAPYAPQKPYNKSVRDVIAHLRAWQQISLARLEAAHLHRDPEFPGWPADFESDSEDALDRTNAWIYETSREQPWPRVHREWREGFLRFLELGEALPEKDLLDAGRYSWLEGRPLSLVLLSSYEHHQEHREPLPMPREPPHEGAEIKVDMKLELVPVPVADVDRAKAFYVEKVGFHLDHDVQPSDTIRVVQLTPPGSACSIVIGTGMGEISEMRPGSVKALHLVVADIAQARETLAGRGVEVGEVVDLGNIFYVSFSDPDGNSWLLQEIP